MKKDVRIGEYGAECTCKCIAERGELSTLRGHLGGFVQEKKRWDERGTRRDQREKNVSCRLLVIFMWAGGKMSILFICGLGEGELGEF